MPKFEELKKEIYEMSLDDFMKLVGEGIKDYICSDIKVPNAKCINHQEYDCIECIRAYLQN